MNIYKKSQLSKVSEGNILCNIALITSSGLFMTDKDFTEILGGIVRDEDGKIVGAKAVLHNFFGKMNSTQALVEVHSLMDAVGVYVSSQTVIHNVPKFSIPT